MKKTLIFIAIITFFGCKTVKNAEIVEKITEKVVVKHVFDSVLVEKTDTFRQFLRGDTVIIEQIKWRNRVKIEIKTDTVVRNNTVYDRKITTITEKIPFYRRDWFAYLIMSVIILLVVFIKKYLRL